MLKKSLFGIIILSVASIILIWGLSAIIGLTVIKYWGEKVTVSIVEMPLKCSKYNRIKILHEGDTALVKISKSECRNRVFNAGQQITLLKHPAFDEFVWPNSNPEIVFVIVVALLAFAYFSTRKKYRTHAHPAPHKHKT